MSLKPIVMIAEDSISALNYYVIENQDYIRLFHLVPALEFFRIEGKSDADEPFEFSYCSTKKMGGYSEYPKLYKILPNDSRRAKKEALNEQIMKKVETYQEEIAEFKRPPELDEMDIYFGSHDNRLYLNVRTNNKNGGKIWAVFDASDLSQIKSRVLKKVLFAVVIAILPLIALAVVTGRLIAGPLDLLVHQLTHQVEHLDFSKSIEVNSHFTEINQAVAAMNSFIEKIKDIIKDMAGNAETLNTSSHDLSSLSHQMATKTDEMSNKSNSVASAAGEMSSNMNSVAATVEQASTNVGMVASAAEKMTTTINEIARDTEKARFVTSEAVSQAQGASNRVDELGAATKDIGKVTATITEISEQTNLLALNATIEAARAGEAGKGFAVVANEIKELAKQTTEATQDIRNKIQGVQDSTAGTVTQIEEISHVINNVNEMVSTIAAAVEQQSVTTKKIADNVAQASHGIKDITENVAESSTVAGKIAGDIADVNQAASEMSNSSSQVDLSTEELSILANQLKKLVKKFKI
ncbi:MAG: hypothetical protein BA861_11525 [Desulfobacterales bacterium S3730MH5]|nr:MAG: hypothetical protein BA861_11525 [Desulfobacterales bacterium S3730MH5]